MGFFTGMGFLFVVVFVWLCFCLFVVVFGGLWGGWVCFAFLLLLFLGVLIH